MRETLQCVSEQSPRLFEALAEGSQPREGIVICLARHLEHGARQFPTHDAPVSNGMMPVLTRNESCQASSTRRIESEVMRHPKLGEGSRNRRGRVVQQLGVCDYGAPLTSRGVLRIKQVLDP